MNPDISTHLDRLYAANDRLKELNKDLPDHVRVTIARNTWAITLAHAEMVEAIKKADHERRLEPMRKEDWEKIDYPNNI